MKKWLLPSTYLQRNIGRYEIFFRVATTYMQTLICSLSLPSLAEFAYKQIKSVHMALVSKFTYMYVLNMQRGANHVVLNFSLC